MVIHYVVIECLKKDKNLMEHHYLGINEKKN